MDDGENAASYCRACERGDEARMHERIAAARGDDRERSRRNGIGSRVVRRSGIVRVNERAHVDDAARAEQSESGEGRPRVQ
jgi:hypothetical protein